MRFTTSARQLHDELAAILPRHFGGVQDEQVVPLTGSIMFDKEYFETQNIRQYEQLGCAQTRVILHSGREFRVDRIDQALDGYVLLIVFPEDGVSENTKQDRRRPGGTDEVFWDRVAVAYESISHVWLSVSEPEREKHVGFEVK